MSSIRNIHSRLSTASSLPVDTEEYVNDIIASREFSDNYCCNTPEYLTEIEILKTTTPSVVSKNTIGSYLYGCFQPELAIDIKCTPECITGLRNPTFDKCQLPVYQKINGDLVLISKGEENSNALVFLNEDTVLSSEDQEYLYNQNVRQVTLNYRDGNTINYLLGETVNIDDEPEPENNVASTAPQNYYWGWLLLIILIIILVAAFFFLRR